MSKRQQIAILIDIDPDEIELDGNNVLEGNKVYTYIQNKGTYVCKPSSKKVGWKLHEAIVTALKKNKRKEK